MDFLVLLNIQLSLLAIVQVSEIPHMKNRRWVESGEWHLRVSSDLHMDTNVCTDTHNTKQKHKPCCIQLLPPLLFISWEVLSLPALPGTHCEAEMLAV